MSFPPTLDTGDVSADAIVFVAFLMDKERKEGWE
jgi:hypothetical protein